MSGSPEKRFFVTSYLAVLIDLGQTPLVAIVNSLERQRIDEAFHYLPDIEKTRRLPNVTH